MSPLRQMVKPMRLLRVTLLLWFGVEGGDNSSLTVIPTVGRILEAHRLNV